MTLDGPTLEQLIALRDKIAALPDPRRANAEWKQAYNLLKKSGLTGNHVDNVIAMRNVDGFAKLIEEHRGGAAGDAVDERPDEATCKAALKAFKRRLKLEKLDDESRIVSRNPLTAGQGSSIRSIQPPRDWPDEVWRELVRQGRLKESGRGFYELAE